MKLCRFETAEGAALGVVAGEEVADLSDSGLPPEPAAALDRAGRERLEELAAEAPRLPLADMRLLAPATPRKYLAIALNYAEHVAELGMEPPEAPTFFNKQVTCVVGPDADVHMPRVSTFLDYEAELAVVIGRRCRHVAPADAADVIAGYTCANDVSVRDWQGKAKTMTIGKSSTLTARSGRGWSPKTSSATRTICASAATWATSCARTPARLRWSSTASSRLPTSPKRSRLSPAM